MRRKWSIYGDGRRTHLLKRLTKIYVLEQKIEWIRKRTRTHKNNTTTKIAKTETATTTKQQNKNDEQ